jgi:3',5'-cyclic-nucleotide phosphodiesterase
MTQLHQFHIMSETDQRQTLEFEGDTIFVGRSPDNDIQIRDRYISRKHLKILRKGDKYFIEDLQSKNGTFVNANQIKPGIEFELKEGIPIVVGMSVICIGIECPEEMEVLMDSIELFMVPNQTDTFSTQTRPKTLQTNMELIYNVTNVLTEPLPVDEILEKILNHIFDVFTRIERGVIILTDIETGEFTNVVSKCKEGIDDSSMMYSRAVVDRVIKEGQAVMILDDEGEAEANDLPDTLKLLKIKSVMCVPLMSKSKVRGVIYVDSFKTPNGFRKEDLSLFTALSNTVAVAIENASLDTTIDRGI